MNIDIPLPATEAIGIAACLLGSAFFSASETALTSISNVRVRLLMEQNVHKYGILKNWLHHKKRILATLLIGNNLVNILFSVLAYRMAERLIPNYAEVVSVFGATAVILIFGEITPKGLALGRSEQFAGPALRILWLLDKILMPISTPLSRIPGLFKKRGNGNGNGNNSDIEDDEPMPTEDEIEFHIRRGLARDVFEEDGQGQLLMSAMEFTDTVVREVMIPRIDMVALEVNTPLSEAVEAVMESGHSRLPVYSETPDSILGILYAKDLLRQLHLQTNCGSDTVPIINLIREGLFFVPESQKIQTLLTDMRRRGLHLAIVVDEFGGTAGLVTLEDVIEELVGEIRDEHDHTQKIIRKIEENRYQVNAHMPIYDFEEHTGMHLPHSENYESVGGLVLAVNGRIPKKGKVIDLPPYQIVVADADDRRIKRLEIRLLPSTDTVDANPVRSK